MTEEQVQYLKLLKDHPGWGQIEDYLEKQIAGLRNELEKTEFQDLGQVAKIQARLQAYREVLEYPATKIKQFEFLEQRRNLNL